MTHDSNYEAAQRRLAIYEEDFRRFEEENRDQPAEWWDEKKQQTKRSLAEMRAKIDALKDSAPDAWGEMKESIGQAFAELSLGYRRAIRELDA